MQRVLNKSVYVIAAITIAYSVWSQYQGPNSSNELRRPVVHEVDEEVTPPISFGRPTLPVVTIQVPDRHPSTGTAFSVSSGWWLTARHVADGCDRLGLIKKGRKAINVTDVRLHPNADLALLASSLKTASLPFAKTLIETGEQGFASGYPKGRAGDVHGQMLGSIRMRSVGRYRLDEPVIAWAEKARIPRGLSALSGLSGGPTFNKDGQVVGVLVAGSERRGRFMTTAPRSINWLMRQSHIKPTFGSKQITSPANFVRRGESLRKKFQIAKVICYVKRSPRRVRQ